MGDFDRAAVNRRREARRNNPAFAHPGKTVAVVVQAWADAEVDLTATLAALDAAQARVAEVEEERNAAQRDLVVALQKCERQRKALYAVNRALSDERSNVDAGPQRERFAPGGRETT